MKRKILIAVGRLCGGGAERVATIWANELVKQGYEVSLLIGFRVENEYEINPRVIIQQVAETNQEFLSFNYFVRLKKMREIIKKVKPDYIIPFLPKMQIYMMLSSIGTNSKRIETIRVNPWRVIGIGKRTKHLWKMCYHTADKIILQSNDQKDFFTDKDQKKCVVVPNPISPVYETLYKKDTTCKIETFIAAGRIGKQKNYEMMIKAFSIACKNNPNIILNIFGSGEVSYIQKLSSLVKQLNMENHIFFKGRSATIEKEYLASDAFIMTSDFEGLPNALMEAMASRLICISTDCKTGPRDLITDGVNGFLAPVDNPEAFANKIEKVINMDMLGRERMVDTARDKILTYCSTDYCTKLLCDMLD